MNQPIQVLNRDTRFQRAETLKRNRLKRRRAGVCFVEGVIPINAVLAAGATIEAVWYAAHRPRSDWANAVLARTPDAEHVEVVGALLDELSDREERVELVALVAIPLQSLETLEPDSNGLIVVLDRPTSPGNLGTVVRTAAAFGATTVIVSGHAADPFDPKAIAASRGAVFAVAIAEVSGATAIVECRDRWQAAGVPLQLVGASAHDEGSAALTALDFSGATALMLGNEAAGLSRAFIDSCDYLAHIPMSIDVVDSLNVGVAAGILIHEIVRQRTADRAS